MPQPTRIVRISAIFAFSFLILPLLAHAGTWVAFQNTYTRSTGAPVTMTNTFTLLNPATQYTLKAFNGGLQNSSTELVSSSFVLLNGVQMIGPSDFSQNVAEVNVTIFPGPTNTISVQVRGQPGGVLTVQVIGVDNDPPTITASVSPTPNAAGWNNSPVTVTFTCSDKTSGVASCPSPVTVGTEGANQIVSGTATDLAGNTAAASTTVNLDMTPPTITATINPPPDSGGYNSGPVTVTFTCSDALSGVASCPAPVSVTTEGTSPVPGTAIDVAGNLATITVTVNISLNYFKIQSWQTGPAGNAKSPSGKCLDYGVSPSGNGATVFLNDCSAAHPIRVVELNPRAGSAGTTLSHEVLLFAGNTVIGIHNPPTSTLGGPLPPPPTEYGLELQYPFTYPRGPLLSNPANQIFRLDGDSIILEGASIDPSTGLPVPGPCINIYPSTNTSIPPPCPGPPPQLVIQVQNARGANGSPLVASVRNLADNEFWDFNALDGSGKHPTGGFVSVASPDTLWNAICSNPAAASVTSGCSQFKAGWGSVIVVSSPSDCRGIPGPLPGQTQDIGGCIDLSSYAPIVIPAGVTVRGGRRGTNSGPQLYQYKSSDALIFEISGDYVRVTGLRLRGQSRSTDSNQLGGGTAVQVDSLMPEVDSLVPAKLAPFATTTQFIAAIDHNDVSDWTSTAINASGPYYNDSKINYCSFSPLPGTSPVVTYNQTCAFTIDLMDPTTQAVVTLIPVADDSSTLANVRVARNFIHHNQKQNNGYGVGTAGGGRALIEGNTFDWNRHAIASDAEPHDEYRAVHNLVLASSSFTDQDFDVHGSIGGYSGTAGFYVDIGENTFLATNRANYWLRGTPLFYTDFHRNVSRRSQSDAVRFVNCSSGCNNDYTSSPFPINIYPDNQFNAPDHTSTLRVGDFDGDGDDDLFMATGNTWLYSPAGQREWRYLNSAPDTIDQLLFGDFDGDGRTDVVAMRNGQLVISWGGISGFDVLNSGPLPCSSMADMAVGDFDGDGKPDIFCADGTTWWISYGGNTPFIQVIGEDLTRVKDLRFGDFNGDGTTDVFGVVNGRFTSPQWQVRYGPKGFQGVLGGWQALPVSLTSNPASADGLVVADFDGNGIADVGMPCSSGGVLGIGASPGWQISYGGAQGWSNCTAFASPLDGANCALISSGLNSSPCVTLASGAVGRFSGGPGVDILLWNYYNSQGASTLWDFPGAAGTPYQLSAQDVDMR